MPLYEYSCAACGAVSEINHRMSDPAPTDCPACGAPKLSKMISAAGFRLKGAGWYETDFKSEGKRNLAGDSAAATGDAAKTEAKTAPAKSESKPEAKSETKPAATPAAKPSSPGSSAST